MWRVAPIALVPVASLLAPFGLVWLWRLLERGYTSMFIALSIGDSHTIENMPDGLAVFSIIFALALSIPTMWSAQDEWDRAKKHKHWVASQEASLRWRIERELDRKYENAMRDFVRKQAQTERLPNNRAPVVVEQ